MLDDPRIWGTHLKRREVVMLNSYFSTGVEKKNDDLRRNFHSKINRWDAATNLLLVEKWQEVLRNYCREKRSNLKRKSSFWSEGGKQEAAKKVVRHGTECHHT